jgi:hypothetical protein
MVFENRILRQIFWPIGLGESFRKWNFKGCTVHLIYVFRVNKSRRLRLARNVARIKKRRGASIILTDKPIGKRPLAKPRRKWENI